MRWSSLRLTLILGALLLALAFVPAGGQDGTRLFVDVLRPGGTCNSPNADNGAVNLHGWQIPAGGLTYKVHRGSIPKDVDKDQALVAIQAGAAAWDDNTAATLLTYGGTTTVKAGKRDGVNAISFGGAPYGAIAVAYIWADGTVVEADMSLGTGFKWATNTTASGDCGGADSRMDVWNIVTHEIGHWVGVGHTSPDSANNAQSMYPYAAYKELFKRDIASGDRTGLESLYGP
ncbi:MAG: matrixin family metalloprotease [Chloroflexi bacterium]|nr:matrixin family metalloprotease [Chloroflexota bacterium]